MVDYFIKLSKVKQQNNYQQLPAASITMVDDMKAMVSLFKHPEDSKMPTTKAKLIEQYELAMNCCKEDRSCLKEGEQAIVEDAKGENTGGGGVDQEEL